MNLKLYLQSPELDSPPFRRRREKLTVPALRRFPLHKQFLSKRLRFGEKCHTEFQWNQRCFGCKQPQNALAESRIIGVQAIPFRPDTLLIMNS